MLLGGLWHGANWTFVLWGAWHGGWLAIERLLGMGKYKSFNVFAWLFTLLLVVIGWVMFRANSVGQAFDIYSLMFGFKGLSLSTDYALKIQSWQLFILIVGCIVVLFNGARQHSTRLQKVAHNPLSIKCAQVISFPLFLVALSSLIASSYSPFLYFQF